MEVTSLPGIKARNQSSQIAQKRIKFNFDVPMLNALLYYTQSEYIGKSELFQLHRLMDYVDSSMYRNEPPIYERIETLRNVVDLMEKYGIQNHDLLQSYLRMEYETGIKILENINFSKNKLNVSECTKITEFILEKLQYIEIYQKKDELINYLRDIDADGGNYTSQRDLINNIKVIMSELLASIQDNTVSQGLLHDFAFSDEEATKILQQVIMKRQAPSTTIETGIRQLNAILSGGFKGGRLYTILGGSGKFKSGTLLNIADQIRLFNPAIVPYENGLRKCVLFITLENSIEETIERLYDMYSPIDSDIRNSSIEDIIAALKNEGGFAFSKRISDRNPENPDEKPNYGGIDIYMKYAGNLEISTGDIYTYVADLYNKGFQPICIVLDYIKRIDSVHPSNGDERVRMSFVAKELKSIAQFYNIPVITAMQLNRDGNSIIDAAMRDNKQDVARFVGSASIGNAWDIIEDSDWVCLINLELQKSTQRLFLTFKRLKIREKKWANTIDYFNHPFVDAKNIRLEPDVDKEKPISVVSLANDLESIYEEEEDQERVVNLQKKLNKHKNSSSVLIGLKGMSVQSMAS